METALRKLIEDARDKIDLYRAPRLAIEQTYKQPCANNACNRRLHVAVVCAPCHGFGDVIFATKFARYLKFGLTPQSNPYTPRVSIITPTPEMFKKLGVKDVKIVKLSGGSAQCRRLRAYRRPAHLPTLDLIFIAPLMQDFDIVYTDVKGLFKESTPFNTLFLSEYQDDPSKEFDILTGAGKGYDGMLFDGAKAAPRLKTLGRTPFALAYMTHNLGLPYCMSNFVKMIAVKYHKKHDKFQVVMPEWCVKKLQQNRNFRTVVFKYYPTITFRTKDDETTFQGRGKSGKTLLIRGDILPVHRDQMLSLIKHSVRDILLTGDQSVTDVIDCCPQKTVWYHTVPWKYSFADALALELPQKYLADARTSCGTMKAIRWNNSRTTFKTRNDFRKKAKHTLDAAFRAASEARKKNTIVHKYLAQLSKSAGRKALLETLN